MSLLHDCGMGEKIIAGGPGDQKGDEQQADQKGRQRKESQSLEEGCIGYIQGQR